MAITCQLDVLSIECVLFSGLIKKIKIIGIEGELGIYPGHSPLLTIIKPSEISFMDFNNQTKLIYLPGGIIEVHPNHIIIMVNSTIYKEDV